MANKLFREKSLKRISSPEELDRYLRVSNPSTWIVLTAICALIIAFCVWGALGEMETIVEANGIVENGQMSVVLSDNNSQRVEEEMVVCLDDKEVGKVSSVSITSDGARKVEISTTSLADGKYALDIVVEKIKPMNFIFNQ